MPPPPTPPPPPVAPCSAVKLLAVRRARAWLLWRAALLQARCRRAGLTTALLRWAEGARTCRALRFRRHCLARGALKVRVCARGRGRGKRKKGRNATCVSLTPRSLVITPSAPPAFLQRWQLLRSHGLQLAVAAQHARVRAVLSAVAHWRGCVAAGRRSRLAGQLAHGFFCVTMLRRWRRCADASASRRCTEAAVVVCLPVCSGVWSRRRCGTHSVLVVCRSGNSPLLLSILFGLCVLLVHRRELATRAGACGRRLQLRRYVAAWLRWVSAQALARRRLHRNACRALRTWVHFTTARLVWACWLFLHRSWDMHSRLEHGRRLNAARAHYARQLAGTVIYFWRIIAVSRSKRMRRSNPWDISLRPF